MYVPVRCSAVSESLLERVWISRVWRDGNPPTLLLGTEIGVAAVENSTDVP